MWQPALTLGRKSHDKGKNRELTSIYLFAIAEFFNGYYF